MGSVGTFPIFPVSGSFGTPILSRFPKPPKGFGTGNRSGNCNGLWDTLLTKPGSLHGNV
jgi:hypothetical protein